ncbi:response regulator [Candidatus Kaiserbacteria bacterium]|nr:response regulator [Candidatus Kaiserbacteria bacterium]
MSDKKYKILLLDDDQFLIDMYSLKFNQAGHTVQPCFSVDEALKALHDGFAPDAVLFDLVMPGKDGFDFLRGLKEEKLAPNATLIALTNQSADEEKKKTEEVGTEAYIVKAMTIPSEVVHMVIAAIEKK